MPGITVPEGEGEQLVGGFFYLSDPVRMPPSCRDPVKALQKQAQLGNVLDTQTAFLMQSLSGKNSEPGT